EIEIGENTAKPKRVPRWLSDARRHRDVLETARTNLAVEADHLVFEVRDGDARPAGVVEVARINAHPRASLAIGRESDAGVERDVAETPVTKVAIQLVRLRVVGDEQVGPAVAVVVDRDDAERLRAGVEDPASARDVFERAIATVVEQPARVAAVRLGRAVRFLPSVDAAEHVMLR